MRFRKDLVRFRKDLVRFRNDLVRFRNDLMRFRKDLMRFRKDLMRFRKDLVKYLFCVRRHIFCSCRNIICLCKSIFDEKTEKSKKTTTFWSDGDVERNEKTSIYFRIEDLLKFVIEFYILLFLNITGLSILTFPFI